MIEVFDTRVSRGHDLEGPLTFSISYMSSLNLRHPGRSLVSLSCQSNATLSRIVVG